MKPSYEAINMLNIAFPVKAFIRSYREEEDIYVHPHWHEAVEILYIIEGRAKQQINERIFDAGKNNLVIIPGKQIHSTYANREEKNEILVIQFDVSILKSSESIISENKLVDRFLEAIDFPDIINASTFPGREATECILGIYDELKEGRDCFEFFTKSFILKLVGILIRNYSSRNKLKVEKYDIKKAKDMLKNTFRLIDNSFSNKLSLEDAVLASNFSVPLFADCSNSVPV